MLSVITLIHNQANNLPTILNAYCNQSVQPLLYVFVLDRCTDNSESLLLEFAKDNPVKIVINNNGLSFQAGYCRDLGLLETHTNVLFLDGDCIPSDNLFKSYDDVLNSTEPVIAISKRKNLNKDLLTFTPDSRETTPWYVNWVFGEDNITIEHLELARVRMLTWSCSLGINTAALLLIMNINIGLGFSGRVFPPVFDGRWGGEDDHIGYIAMLMNIKTIGLSINNYVTHIWHESRNNPSYEDDSTNLYNALLEYCRDIDSPGVHFANVDIDGYVSKYLQELRNSSDDIDITIDEPFDN